MGWHFSCISNPMDLNTIEQILRPRGRADLPAWRDGDAWLGGGTWLFSEPHPALRRMIDLGSLGWTPVLVTDAGLEIAATCRIVDLDGCALPPSWTAAPLVGQCCRAFVASFKIWNVATVGGNVCAALPAGPMISLMTALEGICVIWTADGGTREMPVTEFVLAPRVTALGAGELLRAVRLPAAAMATRAVFRQIALSKFGRSAALVIGTLRPSDGTFSLTVTASVPRPLRLEFPSLPSTETLVGRIDEAVSAYYDDIHGRPDWRRHMTRRFAAEIRAELAGGAAP
jgi:CO/xanthine dehydrogenase FAD-binding subunit